MKSTIVVLKSGETVITSLQEVYGGEGEDKKGICLMMNYPYRVSIRMDDSKKKTKNNTQPEVQVEFSKWCPFSVDTNFKIPYDGVLAIGAPEPGLEEAYKKKVEQYQEKEKVKEEIREYTSDVSIIGAGVK